MTVPSDPPIPCAQCGTPATVQTHRPATDAEAAAYQAQYAHLPAGSPALAEPMQVSEPVCCDHHGPDAVCPDCVEVEERREAGHGVVR